VVRQADVKVVMVVMERVWRQSNGDVAVEVTTVAATPCAVGLFTLAVFLWDSSALVLLLQ
jgi:hypothetical protein